MKAKKASRLVSIGYGNIDEEHGAMGLLIDRMEAALDGEGGEAEFRRLLERLIQDAGVHVLSEQRLMRTHSYPGLEGHARDHERLLEDLRRTQASCGVGEDPPSRATAERLRTLLGDHVEGQDIPLGRFLQGQASSV